MRPWTQLRAALWGEWLKFRCARTVWVTTIFLVAGVPAMSVLTLLALDGENPLLAGKAQALVGSGGWDGLFAAAGAIVSVGGLLGFGVVIGWVFGREFTEGTIGGLFALPVSRGASAAAKLLLVLLWPVAVALGLVITLLAAGAFLTAGALDKAVPELAVKLLVITVLTGLLALPCAWAATRGRGYLAAIAVVIAIVVGTQMAVMAGSGGWFPFAAPGVWAASPEVGADGQTIGQLLLVLPFAAAAGALTVGSWRRLTITR